MLELVIIEGIPAAATIGLKGQVGGRTGLRSIDENGACTATTTCTVRSTSEYAGLAIGAIGRDGARSYDVAHVHDDQTTAYTASYTGGGVVRIATAAAAAQVESTQGLGMPTPGRPPLGLVPPAPCLTQTTHTARTTITTATATRIVVVTTTTSVTRCSAPKVAPRKAVPRSTKVHRIEAVPHVARCAGDVLPFSGGFGQGGGHVGGAHIGARCRLVLGPPRKPRALAFTVNPPKLNEPATSKASTPPALPFQGGQIRSEVKVRLEY